MSQRSKRGEWVTDRQGDAKALRSLRLRDAKKSADRVVVNLHRRPSLAGRALALLRLVQRLDRHLTHAHAQLHMLDVCVYWVRF